MLLLNTLVFFSNWFVSVDCHFVLTADSGTIHTPNFPDKHPNNITCIWNIKVQPGRFILLSFHVFDLESYRGKCIDLVEVKDGGRQTDELLGEYAGYMLCAGLSWLQQSSDSTKQLTLGLVKNRSWRITMVPCTVKGEKFCIFWTNTTVLNSISQKHFLYFVCFCMKTIFQQKLQPLLARWFYLQFWSISQKKRKTDTT